MIAYLLLTSPQTKGRRSGELAARATGPVGELVGVLHRVEAPLCVAEGGPVWRGGHVVHCCEGLSLCLQLYELVEVYPCVPGSIHVELALVGQQGTAGVLVLRGQLVAVYKLVDLIGELHHLVVPGHVLHQNLGSLSSTVGHSLDLHKVRSSSLDQLGVVLHLE